MLTCIVDSDVSTADGCIEARLSNDVSSLTVIDNSSRGSIFSLSDILKQEVTIRKHKVSVNHVISPVPSHGRCRVPGNIAL